ncbi:iron-sulfur cluster assembly accessory protein [Fulvivirga sp. RKSG066]|uniref:HesB/IscA family protein n=1 Tax=Fulvivirga aurantia TaxID=2529383 RepID=UPI0012BCFE22|nr:iron-sulfur cluster assembly accessory protein [Fulvivirga aurantia]MTI21090.1 iron-sulfur cluster assembly accessory protein [Fulvivirga aurantia]
MNLQPVTLTDRAAKEVENIMNNKNIPEGYGLRVGIKGSGGCVGFTYMLGFDKKQEGDIEYQVGTTPIYIEKKHTMYLIGLEVDFYEGSDARGFTFVKAGEESTVS